MRSLGKLRLEWHSIEPLSNAETRLLEAGGMTGVTGVDYFDCTDCEFLTFSVLASHDCSLTIRGCLNETFTDVIDLGPFSITGGAVYTPYNLPAPYSGSGGWLPVHLPFIRLVLADTAASAHSSLIFYARAW